MAARTRQEPELLFQERIHSFSVHTYARQKMWQ